MNAAKMVPSVIQYRIDLLSLVLFRVISISRLSSMPRMAKGRKSVSGNPRERLFPLLLAPHFRGFNFRATAGRRIY
jgi:hypothetical protein